MSLAAKNLPRLMKNTTITINNCADALDTYREASSAS